ncbi:MAG: MASE1 domain-containing protein [Rhodanobacter sp.]
MLGRWNPWIPGISSHFENPVMLHREPIAPGRIFETSGMTGLCLMVRIFDRLSDKGQDALIAQVSCQAARAEWEEGSGRPNRSRGIHVRGGTMRKGFSANIWLRHIAVAVVYAIGVSLFRQLSISHWLILSGLHLSVLLLTKYRYWPALVLGESVSLAYLSYTCADQLGLAWALTNLVPSIVFIAPIVYWVRERGRIFVNPRTVDMGVLLLCALVVAGVVTLDNLGTLLITRLPAGYPQIHYGELAARWMLGNYLGILTITPLVLLAQQEIVHGRWRDLGRKFVRSRLLLESACIMVPVLSFLVWIGLYAAPDAQTRQIAQIAMFVPVVWLALRHGWHGAALGGTAASLAIIALMPHRYDHNTLQAEVVIAFVISTMLLMGERIALLDRRAQTEHTGRGLALALAQRNVQTGETQLRMTSQALEQIRETVQSGCMMLMNRLRALYPALDERSCQSLALVAQDQIYRLADSLYPVSWQERGLPAALREGPVPRTLDEAGIRYWCDLHRPLIRLSTTLQLAVYRVVCEAVVGACSGKNVTEVDIRLRCGEHAGRRWVVIRISFRVDPVRLARVRWDELLPRITRVGSGRGFRSIEDRAATFEGRARERTLPDGRRISVLLLDPEAPGSVECRRAS